MTKIKSFAALAALIAASAGGSYALAEPTSTPAKPAQAPACDGAACDHSAAAMKHECPMMNHGAMLGVTVQVKKTEQGATLEITAKNAADSDKVLQMAQKVAKHMESGCKGMGGGDHGTHHDGHETH